MTQRLYYDDPFLREFDASVTGRREADGGIWVALDRTAFYPGGGGQPPDRGSLEGRLVREVSEVDGIIWHALDGPLEPGARVHAAIDWPRRFDHMQQHTGQHVLSAAFLETAGAETRSFHMGEERSTIDVGHPGPDPPLLARVEERANQVIWDDREVSARIVPRSEIGRVPLRKAPAVDGDVRVVSVAEFDLSACGGTHVVRSGQIGSIAILATERHKGGTRVEFVCGGRALRHHRVSSELVRALAEEFTVGSAHLPAAIARLREERDQKDRRLRALLRESLEREAAALVEAAPRGTFGPVVTGHFADRDAAEVGALGSLVAARGGIALLLAGRGMARAHFSAPPGTMSMAALLGALCRRHGGKGGGRPESAQGAVPESSVAAVLEQALRHALSGDREETTG